MQKVYFWHNGDVLGHKRVSNILLKMQRSVQLIRIFRLHEGHTCGKIICIHIIGTQTTDDALCRLKGARYEPEAVFAEKNLPQL